MSVLLTLLFGLYNVMIILLWIALNYPVL